VALLGGDGQGAREGGIGEQGFDARVGGSTLLVGQNDIAQHPDVAEAGEALGDHGRELVQGGVGLGGLPFGYVPLGEPTDGLAEEVGEGP
jgi:hypothetical protein